MIQNLLPSLIISSFYKLHIIRRKRDEEKEGKKRGFEKYFLLKSSDFLTFFLRKITKKCQKILRKFPKIPENSLKFPKISLKSTTNQGLSAIKINRGNFSKNWKIFGREKRVQYFGEKEEKKEKERRKEREGEEKNEKSVDSKQTNRHPIKKFSQVGIK